MQANHDDDTRWDESRQCYLDRNGYPVSSRGSIYNAPTGMDGPINKLMLEPTSSGTRIRSATTVTQLEVNSRITNLRSGVSNSIVTNGTNTIDITTSSGGQFRTSDGTTIAATWNSDGFQGRKCMKNCGMYSTSIASARQIAQNERKLLPLGFGTSLAVSGSSWTTGTIDSAQVAIAPLSGVVRCFARVYAQAPNTTMNYCWFRKYVGDVFYDDDEAVATGGVSIGDIRTTLFALVNVAAGEKIGIAVENLNTTKNFQVLDWHFEYIA
mgnify:CR=1 FL=1